MVPYKKNKEPPMKRTLLILTIVFLTSLLAAMPVSEAQTKSARLTATDANGRTITLDQVPQKILVAAKAALMPAHALFLFPQAQQAELSLSKTDQGLGDFFSLVWPQIDAGGRLDQNASVEELITKQSDLILLKATHFESMGRKLDQVGVKNFTMSLETWDEWQTELVELGKLLGDEERAHQLLELYQQRIDLLQRRVSTVPAEQKPTVLLLQGNRSDNAYTFKIAPDAWLQTWVVELVGGKAVWKGSNKAANGWSTVNVEQIASWNPDIVVTVSYNTPASIYQEAIYNSPVWSNLFAVQNGQVYASPSDVMNYIQPVASWILGAQWLAKTIHPELFADLDLEAEIRSFYKDFYGIEDRALLDELVVRFNQSIKTNR